MLKPKVERNLARLDPREVPELLHKIETYDGLPLSKFDLPYQGSGEEVRQPGE